MYILIINYCSFLNICLDGASIMASASAIGHIAIWDLDKRRLQSEIRDAHNGRISGLKFLSNEPLLITNSSDNSIKVRKNLILCIIIKIKPSFLVILVIKVILNEVHQFYLYNCNKFLW